MVLEELRKQVLEILQQKDVTGKELIKTIINENKEKIKSLGLPKYDVENPAAMGNFIAKEIIPHLGVPVYKEKINIRGKKRTLYSLNQNEKRVPVV
ncbi:MAG: hypothetical protein ONB31_10055 [candidate division KSB1 bacterium]|nr:hypothetical protein [candidate division KSB1 bacterium]MDZ7335372.1 hypothetical protein [candidate division KSB1 bacterium]MDZ7357676.1 hypothetical protein [candidate division KSB1 bacterium]MDZ7401531.1 hypothetical protein [candidate division KSB1 bacterium]